MTNILTRDEEIITLLANRVITLKEVGRMYSISGERVRQILKNSGVAKMKKVIVKTPIQLLKESGKAWCSKCKAQDVPLLKKSKNKKYNKQYYMCRPCQAKICNNYYHTINGNLAINKAKAKYNEQK